jgi:hypothetical protein
MAVSHGQYRDHLASNTVQVILVRLTHPLLPLFRRRALCGNPLIPLFRRNAPHHHHLLPLFRRRVMCVDLLIPRFRRRAPRTCRSVILTTWRQNDVGKLRRRRQQRRRNNDGDERLTMKLEASTHLSARRPLSRETHARLRVHSSWRVHCGNKKPVRASYFPSRSTRPIAPIQQRRRKDVMWWGEYHSIVLLDELIPTY